MGDAGGEITREVDTLASVRAYNRLTWLASLGISAKSAREMALDQWGLDDLTWQVVVNEALRRRRANIDSHKYKYTHKLEGEHA